MNTPVFNQGPPLRAIYSPSPTILEEAPIRVKPAHVPPWDADCLNDAHFLRREYESLYCTSVAPSIIVAVPGGRQRDVSVQGMDKSVDFYVDEHWASKIDGNLQSLRASEEQPFFDFDHSAGKTGYPQEFFWQPFIGVMASVNWTEVGDALILSKSANSFSLHWRHNLATGKPASIRARCGALCTNPAFRANAHRVSPQLKLHAVRGLARRFVFKTGALQATGKFSFQEAGENVAGQFPLYSRAWLLLAALREQFPHNEDLK